MRINSNQYNMNFGSVLRPETKKLKVGIFFAGGGGISQAFKKIPDAEIIWLLNHDKTAIKTSSFHNKQATVYWADVYMQDEKEMEPVDLCQASLECDAHTDANVELIKDKSSYAMGWEFYRYLKHLNPAVIHIENVPKFKKWAKLDENDMVIKGTEGVEFERWKKAIMDLGYEYKETICNAADFGLPTRRVRFFCFFYRPGIEVEFPETTHNKLGTDGKKKWVGCRKHIDTDNTGVSIFGRKYNMDLPKHLRKPPVHNSLKRIAGGIKKQIPELYQFLCKFHGGTQGDRNYSLDEPIRTIDTSNRHQLATVEGGQFIQDHCQTDSYQDVDSPLKTQLTWQTKQLVNIEKLNFIMDHCHSDKAQSLDEPMDPQTTRQTKQAVTVQDPFIVQFYGNSIQSNNLDDPINTIRSNDTHQLVRIEKIQFLAKYFNSGGNPGSQTQSLDSPLSTVMQRNKHAIVTILDDPTNTIPSNNTDHLVRKEKIQFLAMYFNSNGNPGANNSSLDEPISTIMTELKHQLVTILDNFDIKVRFLNAEELAACSTFPRDYFSHPELKLSQKSAIQLIGNAVPPEWVYKQMAPNIKNILKYKLSKQSA